MNKSLTRALLSAVLMMFFGTLAWSQATFTTNGVKDKRPAAYAFTNATIYVDYQTPLQNATLLVRDGRVDQVGPFVSIPKDAIVIDLKGKTIYPSFVDPYTNYGLPEVRPEPFQRGLAQLESKTKGAYNWNEAIKSEYDAYTQFTTSNKAEVLRKAGFGAVLSFRNDGIARGTSVLATLNDDRDQNVLVKQKAATHFSFDKGTSRQEFPSSLMGSIALLRQTYLDAQWYKAGGNKDFTDLSLEHFNANLSLPAIFEASNKANILRADKVGDEFGVQYIIKGSGDEYQDIRGVKATGASLIIPINFPEAFDVEDPLDAAMVSLSDLKHWEMAPSNPSVLASNGINFAFTAQGLKDVSTYLTNIRKAVKYGLPETAALKAMTFAPAQMLKAEADLGNLKKGALANFIVTTGNLFADDAIIHQNWVQGKAFEMVPLDVKNYNGMYSLTVGATNYSLEISGKPESPASKVKVNDSTELKSNLKINKNLVSLSFDVANEGKVRLSGWISDKSLKGNGELPNGQAIAWSATYKEELKKDEKKEEKKEDPKPEVGSLLYPFIAFGNNELPKAETILVKNTTVWTNEKEGIITDTDVLLKDGRIAQIGKNIPTSGARIIDGKGKHLTSGIIDEHTHIALSSINDVQSVSAEVRMGDVIDNEDIDIYRQLAGGVVAGQLLHGSANSIGGQSALIKYRWGRSAEELKIQGADGFIKCALGENVKQSNWGDMNTVRYPQTRMGVEQVFEDAFTRALEYEAEWKTYNAIPAKNRGGITPPRKDLELETLVEILNKKRFISCHSYVQSEINMLIKVADKYGFKVNTFTHILEGYKVADKMAQHGSYASTFADWWAYKMEVKEAIPYNAMLMTGAGVVTAINSDDAEMARRLNQEAAKSIKYGNMSEEEAWKMVTLNPAKMLHLDNRMGSIKVGKDADVVLWTENPLSIYAKAQTTIIDGVVYFDLEKDAQVREAVRAEKARLVQKMLDAKKGGAATQKPMMRQKHMWHCEDVMYHANHDHADH